MDFEGYPESEDLEYIEKFDVFHNDIHDLLNFIRSIWSYPCYCKIKGKKVITLELHTGGWSGNEEVIRALTTNYVFWGMYWEKSVKGGHYWFRIKKFKK